MFPQILTNTIFYYRCLRMYKLYHQAQLLAISSEKVIQRPPAKIAGGLAFRGHEIGAIVAGELITLLLIVCAGVSIPRRHGIYPYFFPRLSSSLTPWNSSLKRAGSTTRVWSQPSRISSPWLNESVQCAPIFRVRLLEAYCRKI